MSDTTCWLCGKPRPGCACSAEAIDREIEEGSGVEGGRPANEAFYPSVEVRSDDDWLSTGSALAGRHGEVLAGDGAVGGGLGFEATVDLLRQIRVQVDPSLLPGALFVDPRPAPLPRDQTDLDLPALSRRVTNHTPGAAMDLARAAWSEERSNPLEDIQRAIGLMRQLSPRRRAPGQSHHPLAYVGGPFAGEAPPASLPPDRWDVEVATFSERTAYALEATLAAPVEAIRTERHIYRVTYGNSRTHTADTCWLLHSSWELALAEARTVVTAEAMRRSAHASRRAMDDLEHDLRDGLTAGGRFVPLSEECMQVEPDVARDLVTVALCRLVARPRQS